MNNGRMIIVAGWACSADELADLCSLLSARFDIQATSTARLFSSDAIPDRQSPHPASKYATALHANITKSREPVTIVAWSMGALVALESISKFSAGISRLIIINGTARFCSGKGYADGVPEQNLRAMIAGLSEKPEEILTAFFRDAMFPITDSSQIAERRTRKAIQQGIECLRDGLLYLRHADLRDSLPAIKVPTLIVHGGQDKIIPPSAAEFLHHSIPGSHLVVHENKGHTLMLDRPALIAEDIRTFTEG